MHCMPPARFRLSALAGCALLGACNDTRDLAPASPDTPWQFEPSKEAPTAPAPAAVAAKRFAVPDNTAVQLPSPADIDLNHSYSLIELFDTAQRRNRATRDIGQLDERIAMVEVDVGGRRQLDRRV